jgi:hypothetical protein
MNPFYISLLVLVALAACAIADILKNTRSSKTYNGLVTAFNSVGVNLPVCYSLISSSAHVAYVAVKMTAEGTYDVCGRSDVPIGIVRDEVVTADIGQTRAVQFWGCPGGDLPKITIAAAVGLNVDIYLTAAGKAIPAGSLTTGTNLKLGRTVEAQATVGGVVHFIPYTNPPSVTTA